MSAQETPVSRQPDKRKQRDARKDLSTFLKKLQKACSTFETANDWVDFVGELNGLLQIYQFEIPVDRQDGLKQAMNLTDPTREGIRSGLPGAPSGAQKSHQFSASWRE